MIVTRLVNLEINKKKSKKHLFKLKFLRRLFFKINRMAVKYRFRDSNKILRGSLVLELSIWGTNWGYVGPSSAQLGFSYAI